MYICTPRRFVRAHGGDHIVVNHNVTLQGYSLLVRTMYVIHARWRFVRAHGGDHIVVNRNVTLHGYSVSVWTIHHVQGSQGA